MTHNLRRQLLRIQRGSHIGLATTANIMLGRSKPPNILVYAGEASVKAGLVDTVRDVVRTDTYTVYPVMEAQMEARAWLDSTALLMVYGRVDDGVAQVVLDYFLDGGKVMVLCSNLLRWVLPNRVKDGVSRRESVSVSYDRWQNLRMMQEMVQWVGDAEEYNETARNSAGVDRKMKVKILVRDTTFNTPSILSISSWQTGGDGIFTQLYLNDDRSPERDILRDLLDKGLKISTNEIEHQQKIQYKNAFLIGSVPSINHFLKSFKSVIDLGSLQMQFTSGWQDPDDSSETKLSVVTDRNPEDFSIVDYYRHLRASAIGRIAIYSPMITSSMEIVSNATFRHGFVVIPRCQSRGSGRHNNQWLSPEGCAMFSLQLHVPLNSALGQRLPIIQHLVAVAVVKAIRGTSGYEQLDIGVKWPNDIYARGCTKIGGLIINSQLCGAEAIVNVGCGVNLNNSSPTLCINDLIREYNRLEGINLPLLGYEQTLAMIFNEIEKLFNAVQSKDDLQALYELYYKYWLHSDKSVIVKDQDGMEVSGTISGIDDYGYLLVNRVGDDKPICVHPDGNSFDMMKGLIIPKYF